MDYLDLHRTLKKAIMPELDTLRLGDGLWVSQLDFTSGNERILSGESHYSCSLHGALDSEPEPSAPALNIPPRFLDSHDSRIKENRNFRYAVFHGAGARRAGEVLLLFHGLNEKDWHKYLPWAHRLALVTGKAVVLFPIAFHMNRAPAEWSEPRLMHRLSEQRRGDFPDVVGSSLSNVAISSRLHAQPQRFIWSGLQTYFDVVQLLKVIHQDRHPLVEPGARVDILGYSIGGLLAQVLLMTNPEHLLDRSRLCLFCGGALFNRILPVSKFILDSETSAALRSYLVTDLERHLGQDPRLRHYLGGAHPEGLLFRSMLNEAVLGQEREAQFRRIAPRLLAIALEQDTVMPPSAVINALKGAKRDIPARVEVMDFPYPYQHEDPFPSQVARRGMVEGSFRRVFDTIADFLD